MNLDLPDSYQGRECHRPRVLARHAARREATSLPRRLSRASFARLANQWDHVRDLTEQVHEDGRFVTFLSFEWQSMKYGDHCVYYNRPRGGIIRAESLEELRGELRALAAVGVQAMAIPHHIGYRRGRRGIDWDYFTEEFSPVVEMMSMHGCREHADAPRPYLHSPHADLDPEAFAERSLARWRGFRSDRWC